MHYMMLSHCWGKAETISLTDESYDYLVSGASITALPRPFRTLLRSVEDSTVGTYGLIVYA